MNKYLIQYKIATVANLFDSFIYNGFEFFHCSKDFVTEDAWIASKEIEANNSGIARFNFMKELIPCVERFSTVSQCAFRINANSYFIFKTTNNPDNIVYIYYVRSTPPVGLHFDDEEIAQLDKLSSIPNQKACMYIMEAANATTFFTRLTMLISAAESLAGETVVGKKITTDKNELIKILGNPLYKKLFDYGTGLRNKLFHGSITDTHLFDGLVDETYCKIRAYLITKYDVQMSEEVVHPQRNFHDNFEYTSTFEKFNGTPTLDLRQIEDAFADDVLGHSQKEQKMFTYCSEKVVDY